MKLFNRFWSWLNKKLNAQSVPKYLSGKKISVSFFEKKTPGAREGTPGAALGKEIEKHPGKYVSLFA